MDRAKSATVQSLSIFQKIKFCKLQTISTLAVTTHKDADNVIINIDQIDFVGKYVARF